MFDDFILDNLDDIDDIDLQDDSITTDDYEDTGLFEALSLDDTAYLSNFEDIDVPNFEGSYAENVYQAGDNTEQHHNHSQISFGSKIGPCAKCGNCDKFEGCGSYCANLACRHHFTDHN